MLRVGLTGGIGSGKSEVSRRLAARGAVTVDADVAAREVVRPGTPGLSQIAATFGPEVIRPDGSLDRERLGQIAFADPGLRAELNAIVHPLVGAWMAEREQEAAAMAGTMAPAGIVVHDIPLLAEGGRDRGFDVVLVVDAPDDQRLERLAAERGMSAQDAADRMAAQAGREQRLAIADIVIDNSGTLEDLDRRVGEVWTVLRDRAAARSTAARSAAGPAPASPPGPAAPPGMSDPPPRVEP